RPRPRHRPSAEVRNHRAGDRSRRAEDPYAKRRRERAHPSHQRPDGLRADRAAARAAPRAEFVSEAPYGLRTLPDLYKQWTAGGMIANIGAKLVEAGSGTLVIEGTSPPMHMGFRPAGDRSCTVARSQPWPTKPWPRSHTHLPTRVRSPL